MIVESQRVKDFISESKHSMTPFYQTDYTQFSDGELACILADDLDTIHYMPAELLSPALVDYLIKNVSDSFKVISEIVQEELDGTKNLYTSEHLAFAVSQVGHRAIALFNESAFTPEAIVNAAKIDPQAYSAMPKSVKTPAISEQICRNNYRAFPHIPQRHHTPEIFYGAAWAQYRSDPRSRGILSYATPACWDQKTASAVFGSFDTQRDFLITKIPEEFHTYKMYVGLKGTTMDHLSSKAEILGVQNAKRDIESDLGTDGVGNIKKFMVRQADMSVRELTDVVVNPNMDEDSRLQSAMRYAALYYLGALSESAFAKSVAEDGRLAPIAQVLAQHRVPEVLSEPDAAVTKMKGREPLDATPSLG